MGRRALCPGGTSLSDYDASHVIAQLLRNHEADLKRYIVCRRGDPSKLDEVYEKLRTELVQGTSQRAREAPSLPALAYATARRLALASADNSDLEALDWETTPEHRPPRYGEALDGLRTTLEPGTAEVLELRYARGLGIDEVGFVVGLSPSAVGAVLEDGRKAGVLLAEDLTDTKLSIEKLVQDAFRPLMTPEPGRQRPQVHGPRLASSTVLGGRFEIQSTVEAGPLTSTYLANDLSVPGLSVVVHLFHRPVSTTAARAGALRKLRLISSVVHSSVDRCLDQGWHADRLWYATPWHVGQTLAELALDRPLSPPEAIEVFGPIARGLAALHDRGVILRNVSPDRLLLVETGSDDIAETLPVMSDFDLWILGEGLGACEPRFIAPEVAQRLLDGASEGVGARSEDVFSLGLVLLWSLGPSLRAPEDPAWASFLLNRANETVQISDSNRIAPFAPILRRALSFEPSARPTAAEFARALEKARSKVSTQRERRSLVMPLSVLLAALTLLLVAYFVRASRLQMIREASEGVETEVLQRELEAEKERAKGLESALESLRATQKPPSRE